MRCIVLDAMGVLFHAADDVVDMLIPFIREHGGDAESVPAAYLEASLGTMDPDEFWRTVGLDPSVEDAYLSRHSLMPGVLSRSQHARIPVWCLSNDVGRWSMKLRRRFALDGLLAGAVISSDVRRAIGEYFGRLLSEDEAERLAELMRRLLEQPT